MIRNQAAAFADRVCLVYVAQSGRHGADEVADFARELYYELEAHRGELVLFVSHELSSRGLPHQTILDRIYRLGFTSGAPNVDKLSEFGRLGDFPVIPGACHQAYRSTGWDNSWNFKDEDRPIHLGYPPLQYINKPLNVMEGVIVPPWSTPAPLLHKEVIVGNQAVQQWFSLRGTSMVELYNRLLIKLNEQIDEAKRAAKAS